MKPVSLDFDAELGIIAKPFKLSIAPRGNRMTYKRFRQLAAYAVFLLIAAPLEFNLSAYFNGLPAAMVTGFLYSFAVIASIEAFYRLESHPAIPERCWSVDVLKFLCFVPLVLFALEMIPSWAAANGTNGHALAEHAQFQTLAVIIGVGVAIVTHAYITVREPELAEGETNA